MANNTKTKTYTDPKRYIRLMGWLYGFCIVVSVGVICRIGYLMFFSDYKDMSLSLAYRTETEKAKRGSILTHDGRILAISVPYYRIYMDPTVATDSLFNAQVGALSRELSRFYGHKSAKQMEQEIRTAREKGRKYLQVSNRLISTKEVEEVAAFPLFNLGQNRGGIIKQEEDLRVYPYGRLAHRTIGSLYNENQRGVGIEYACDNDLKGTPGQRRMKHTMEGYVPVDNEPMVQPQNGLDIISTLDIEIQEVADNALRNKLRSDPVLEGGTVIVMDVATGAIRSIVNLKKNKKGAFDEIYNYAITESTNPGSTFKLATLITLLDHGYMKLTDSIATGKNGWTYYQKRFTEASSSGYGTITLQQAFEKSSNVAFNQMAVKYYGGSTALEKKFVNRLRDLKIFDNESFDIELIGRANAVLPSPEERTWSKLSLPSIAMGYEMLLTPLHTLTLYNAVANNGKMVKPYFIEGRAQLGQRLDSTATRTVVLSNAICTKNTLEQVQKALRGVVENGTAKSINDPRYGISGKTGTSKIAFGREGFERGAYRRFQASFAGYFPSNNPKYSMIVVLYTGETTGNFYGATWAAPVFKEVADHIYTTHPFWNNPV